MFWWFLLVAKGVIIYRITHGNRLTGLGNIHFYNYRVGDYYVTMYVLYEGSVLIKIDQN